MAMKPGVISPADMDLRQWSRFISESGIQADSSIRTFTPSWTGFSADPTGDINYHDFGRIVILWADGHFSGTSDSTGMAITNLPSVITPVSGVSNRYCFASVVDNGVQCSGWALISASGGIDFLIGAVSGTRLVPSGTGFTAAGTKGVDGLAIVYAK